ncbi:MAG: flagellar export chaperone FliS [Terracidiphilus sp.]|jgi:flagellar biosynthetic protein FliS
MNQTDLAYRKTAVEGASGFGLLIALYDTLAGDLRRAAAAQRKGNLEERARELKHALLVLGHLENWIDAGSGDLARKLTAFYSRLRRKIIEAQAKHSAEILDAQIAETLRIREVWQRLDLRIAAPGPEILPPERTQRYNAPLLMQMEQSQLSWSA